MLRIIAALAILTAPAIRADLLPLTQAVPTDYGTLVFHLRSLPFDHPDYTCALGASIDNMSPVRWYGVGFKVKLEGIDTHSKPLSADLEFDLEEVGIGNDAGKNAIAFCGTNGKLMVEVMKMGVSILHATPNRADVSELRETQAKAKYLAGLPIVATPAFLASDRKCAMEFQEALKMEGIEKRKRVAELLKYDCGIVIERPAHIEIERQDAAYRLVRIADGPSIGKEGWLPQIPALKQTPAKKH